MLIARALASQPDVLIMDEPTAGVDAANQRVLAAVLERLADRDVTMIIVTHEIGALKRLFTRVVVVDAGRIQFDGTPQQYAAQRTVTHHDYDHDPHHVNEDDNRDANAVALPLGPLDRLRDHHGWSA